MRVIALSATIPRFAWGGTLSVPLTPLSGVANGIRTRSESSTNSSANHYTIATINVYIVSQNPEKASKKGAD